MKWEGVSIVPPPEADAFRHAARLDPLCKVEVFGADDQVEASRIYEQGTDWNDTRSLNGDDAFVAARGVSEDFMRYSQAKEGLLSGLDVVRVSVWGLRSAAVARRRAVLFERAAARLARKRSFF
jgi:hypothetical protein